MPSARSGDEHGRAVCMVGAAEKSAVGVHADLRGTNLPGGKQNSKRIRKGELNGTYQFRRDRHHVCAHGPGPCHGATSQLTTQKGRVTDSLTSLAQAVRQSTESLRGNEQPAVAQYVEQAASQLRTFIQSPA